MKRITLSRAAGTFFAALVALIVVDVSWARIPAHITRSVDRTQSAFHVNEYRSLAQSVLVAIGGVQSQLQTLQAKGGAKAQFQLR